MSKFKRKTNEKVPCDESADKKIKISPLDVKLNETENWKICDDFPNYEISDLGKVMNRTTGNILKYKSKKGRMRLLVTLSKDGKKKEYGVAKLIANTFIENKNGFENVKHIDGNSENNCVSNLVYVSKQKLPNQHIKRVFTSQYIGVSNINKKATQWRALIHHNKKNYHIGTYETEKEAAIAYNNKAIELFGISAKLNKID